MGNPNFPSIEILLSEPFLKDYLSNHYPDHVSYLELIVQEVIKIETFVKRRSNPGEEEQVLVEDLEMAQFCLRGCDSDTISASSDHSFFSFFWEAFLDIFTGMVVSCNYWKQKEEEQWLLYKELVAVINSLKEKDIIENLLLDTTDCNSNLLTPPPNIYEENRSRAFLLVKTFPALLELKEPKEIFYFLLESTKEMDNLPQLIYQACHCQGQALPLLLIGSLLLFKQCDYQTWNKVKDDLVKIKESAPTYKHMEQRILTYCYNNLPPFLKKCFLYLACYPIGYEIPATSLTQLWIAEEFFTPQEGETIEKMSNKYLEQLVQRSLVCVSKRSFLGTIKYCQVPRSIHEFVIQTSNFKKFLVTNPSGQSMPGSRLAVHNDYKESEGFSAGCNLQSILAFHFGGNFHNIDGWRLKVLELRKCSTQISEWLESIYGLRYICLRDSNICDLPQSLSLSLQTLDIRGTGINIVSEYIWSLYNLRHVYVDSCHKIEGPPSTASMSDIQTLKTVAIPKSWLENFPQCLINLRKLALSNMDNPDIKSNPYWKPISDLLSHMVNLLSMRIIGDIVPSEFVDIRAFPNLETVKSIKFEGQWQCRKLIIDNIKFSTNLAKLTLTKSGLKEDPMPKLERLEALKHLSLQDEAYTGNKMVCSENGFPQLQFLELNKLMKLENWEVNPRAMPQLTKLSVFQCLALKKLPDLEHVPNIDTDIK